MSTLKTINVQHPSGATTNIVNDVNGNVTVGGNVSMASSFLRNKILNGAMMIDQRNAGASVANTNNNYTLDRWATLANVNSKFTVQQNAGAVTPPTGYSNYLGVTSSASTSLGASDYYAIAQYIEANNVVDLAWGTSGASAATLSFWVRSSLTGTFGGSVNNNLGTYSYPFSYSIASANTWTKISVSISGPTAGTWGTGTAAGIAVIFGLGVGSSLSGPAGAWASTNYISATGATSIVGTNGATWYITGVQFEVGSIATPFEQRLYPQELALCQRYYEKSQLPYIVPGTDNLSVIEAGYTNIYGDGGVIFFWTIQKRTLPTVTVQAPLTTSSNNKIRQSSNGTILSTSSVTAYSSVANVIAPGAVNATYYQFGWTADAEL